MMSGLPSRLKVIVLVSRSGFYLYSATDFYAEVLRSNSEKTPSHRTMTNERGETLLAAGATWDYIIKHPIYRQGLVDVGAVSDRLKTVAKCDGIGPVFMQSDIGDAIEEGVEVEKLL